MKEVVCFGEVLWDIYSDEKKPGGAPLNVALRMKSFGFNTHMISSVGNDDLGRELLTVLEKKGIDSKHIQISKDFDTGTVGVTLDKNGSASYKINHPVSWDKIELLPEYKKLVSSSNAFIFGSLIARDSVSKKCLIVLLKKSTYKIFDLNLRAPHYSISDLEFYMNQADFIKFNDEEIEEICNAFGSKKNNLEEQVLFISKKTNTSSICVTLGKDGALLLHKGSFYIQKGYAVVVKDTVGAGDSFLGTLISLIINNCDPAEALDKACATGALVCQNIGANPEISETELADFMSSFCPK